MWPALIAAGASVLGGVLTNNMNSAEAAKNRDFQMDASNTAHQREVADLRAAGLNPILSAGGGGASSPNGNVAQMEDPLAKGIASAIAVRQQQKDLEAKDAGIANMNAETKNKEIQGQLLQAQTMASSKDIESKELNNKLLRETIQSAIKKAKVEGDWSEVNQYLHMMNSGVSAAGQIFGAGKFFDLMKAARGSKGMK